jgi:hypothetical protein
MRDLVGGVVSWYAGYAHLSFALTHASTYAIGVKSPSFLPSSLPSCDVVLLAAGSAYFASVVLSAPLN